MAKAGKMSKSVGNVIYPQEIISEFGADVLRLWVASSDFKGDVRVSRDILLQMSEVYRKIRNTARFLLGNLADFEPEKDRVPYQDLTELDRWALMALTRLVEKVTAAYEEYEYHLLYHGTPQFLHSGHEAPSTSMYSKTGFTVAKRMIPGGSRPRQPCMKY